MVRFGVVLLLIHACQGQEMEWNGKRVRGKIADGKFVVEGDMVLGVGSATPVRESAIIPFASSRWPNGVVPYVIDNALPNQGRAEGAVAHWNGAA